MSTIVSQITTITIVYSTVYSGANERKHQSATSLAFVRRIHQWTVNSPHKRPVTRKMFPFDDVIMHWYRNWPRYGLRWSGLCWHCRHSTSGAGHRAAACGRPHECCAGSGSTNHSSADRMSGQFLFYHENEAIHNDKSRDDRDDEPPCWNALAGNAIVMMKASIDTVSEQ